jgi:hypothetical protein
MPSLADPWRKIVNDIRSVIPAQFGLREFSVFVVVTQYSGAQQRGEPISITTQILNNGANPKVRSLTDEERAIGGFPSGTMLVGPITPEYTDGTGTGGTPYSTLSPELQDGETLNYVITGPGHPEIGSRYEVEDIDTDAALRFMVTLRSVASGYDNAVVGP